MNQSQGGLSRISRIHHGGGNVAVRVEPQQLNS